MTLYVSKEHRPDRTISDAALSAAFNRALAKHFNDEDDHDEPDRFFNPNRTPRNDNASRVVETIFDDLERYKVAKGDRKRKRRATDQETYKLTITALVCDLMHHHLLGDGRDLVVPMSNEVLGRHDRYGHRALNQKLPEWVKDLSSPELGWISFTKGFGRRYRAGQRSSIAPTNRFVTLMEEHGVKLKDLSLSRTQETIILKAPKAGPNKSAKLIPYADTEQTKLYRQQINEINEWLAQADIQFDRRALTKTNDVDTQDRFLRRSFNRGSFESGGRLGGSFWMPLDKHERVNGILINGEKVISLDYGQCAPRILYGLAGVTPSSQDLYAIPGIDPRYREGIKLLLSALTFSDAIPKRKPRNSTDKLPKNKDVSELCRLIIGAHPGIATYLPSQIGHYVQFIESQILVSAMLQLKKQGIVSLPVHDCIIVQSAHEEITRTIMLDTFVSFTGAQAIVSKE